VASSYILKYVVILPDYFSDIKDGDRDNPKTHDLRQATEVEFKQGVRILDIFEVDKGQPCLITENHQGCLSFIEMSIRDKKSARTGQTDKLIHFDEISPRIVKDAAAKHDPVVEIRNQMFLVEEACEYKHCGLARRESGSLEFIWNFRIVETMRVEDPLLDGFVDMIDCDFGFMYYRKVSLDISV
jgi:hypothetical protein